MESYYNLGSISTILFEFCTDKNQKISYAASFGVIEINKKYFFDIAKYLEQFKAISVREKEGVALVKKISGIDAECLIDPTFLLTKEQWIELAEEPKNKEPYILVYMMQKNYSVYEYARKIKSF